MNIVGTYLVHCRNTKTYLINPKGVRERGLQEQQQQQQKKKKPEGTNRRQIIKWQT